MHAVIRSYAGQGASELFDLIEKRSDEVKDIIGSVPGFVSYAAFRTQDGGSTVTVCQDRSGTDESSQRAAAWVKENMTSPPGAPQIIEGEAVAQLNA
ncbi:MAG TPA: hypothetical protein VFV76_02160 [Actinomycetes bacterium]|nr:hypothetical protein [Actinomycetes bacterium]